MIIPLFGGIMNGAPYIEVGEFTSEVQFGVPKKEVQLVLVRKITIDKKRFAHYQRFNHKILKIISSRLPTDSTHLMTPLSGANFVEVRTKLTLTADFQMRYRTQRRFALNVKKELNTQIDFFTLVTDIQTVEDKTVFWFPTFVVVDDLQFHYEVVDVRGRTWTFVTKVLQQGVNVMHRYYDNGSLRDGPLKGVLEKLRLTL